MKPAQTTSNYKVGIYVRESRDDNEENFETIETQRELLTDFVFRNNLGEIYRVYIDDNVSGSIFERDGIEQLKADILTKNINMLVAKDLSRLGRNNAKTLLFLDYLEENGVRVITFDAKYDSLKDNDTVGIETWFNERYVRDISRKIRTNLRFKIEKGEYIGHAPFGYKKSEQNKNSLCIDVNVVPIINEIFRLYREGYGYLSIANHLNSKGIPPPSVKTISNTFNKRWSAVSVQRIIRNRVYTGDTVQGISEKVSFKSKKTRLLPSEKWVVTIGTHEAIIQKDEFEEIQLLREKRRRGSGAHKGKIHLLKGILFCGKCGSQMYARERKMRPMGYICGSYFKTGVKACTSHYVNEEILINVIIEQLQIELKKEDVIEKAIRLLDDNIIKLFNDPREFTKLEQQIIAKERQQDVLYMDKLDGKISEQLFIRMNMSIENRISQLKHDLEKMKSKNIEPFDARTSMYKAFGNLNKDTMTNEIIRLLIERVTVFDKCDDLSKIENEYQEHIMEIKGKGAILIEFKLSP